MSGPTSAGIESGRPAGGPGLEVESAPSEVGSDPARGAEAVSLAEVVGLDGRRRLDRKDTIRSPVYEEMRDALSEGDLRRLIAMEEMLFADRPRASTCRPGPLHLPDACFNCTEGSIWFFYAANLRKFVLSVFVLSKPGGRRMPIGCERAANDLQGDCPSQGWGEGIAARLMALLSGGAVPAELPRWPTIAGLVEHRFTVDGECYSLDEPVVRAEVLFEIATTCRAMRDRGDSLALPEWSLLGQVLRTREEGENPYARAIFAGEALCRMGIEIGFGGGHRRALRWGPRRSVSGAAWYSPADARLYDESVAILHALRDHVDPVGSKGGICHFLTASLMDGDMLGDVRRLALVRSELMFRLAMRIGTPTSGRASRRGSTDGRTRDLMRRYALLSEFAHLSNTYFGTRSVDASIEVIQELVGCQHKDNPVIVMVIRDLFEFGNSSAVIVDELAGCDDDRPPDGDAGMRDMCARLVTLTAEIVGNEWR